MNACWNYETTTETCNEILIENPCFILQSSHGAENIRFKLVFILVGNCKKSKDKSTQLDIQVANRIIYIVLSSLEPHNLFNKCQNNWKYVHVIQDLCINTLRSNRYINQGHHLQHANEFNVFYPFHVRNYCSIFRTSNS